MGPGTIRLRFDPFAYRHIRLKVLVRDGYTCYWCGAPGNTIDHIIPWSKGGRTTMENCVSACQECNGMRGDMPAAEFAKLRHVVPPQPNGGRPTGGHLDVAVIEVAAANEASARFAAYALKRLLDPYHIPACRRSFY